jgi:hypothetical protein
MIKSMRMKWAGRVERMGENRNAYGVLVGKPERKKKPLVRPRTRWEINIKMDLKRNRVGASGLESAGSGYE